MHLISSHRPAGPAIKDISPRYLTEDQVVESLNMVTGYGTGVEGARVPYQSFLPSETQPTLHADAFCIGATKDERNGAIYYFIYSPDGDHSVFKYNVLEDTHVRMLSGDFLAFNPQWHVQAKVVGGKLMPWTDGTSNKDEIVGNAPRLLDLERADDTEKYLEYEFLVTGDFVDNTRYRIDFYNLDYTPTGNSDSRVMFGFAGDKKGGLQELTDWLNSLATPEQVTATTDGKSIKFSLLNQTEIRARITSNYSASPSENAMDCLTVPVNHYIFEDIFPVPVQDRVLTDDDREFMISREKYQPRFAVTVEYDEDVNFNSNFIDKKMMQFTYRYVYANDQKSKWAQYSLLPLPAPSDNRATISFDDTWLKNASTLGEIPAIEFAVRYGNDGFFRLIKTMKRSEFAVDGDSSFYFYNDSDYPLVASDEDGGSADTQVLGLFDNVPHISGTLEAISDEDGNTRLVDGSVLLGFDPVRMDVDIEAVAAVDVPSVSDNVYKKTSRYQFGMVYAMPGGKRSQVFPVDIFTMPNWDDTDDFPYTIQFSINHLPPEGASHYYIVRKKNLSYQRWKPLLCETIIGETGLDDTVQYGILGTNEEGFTPGAYADPENTHARFRCVAPWLDGDLTNDEVVNFDNNDTNWFFEPSVGDRFRCILNYQNYEIAPGNAVGIDYDFSVDAFEYETISVVGRNGRFIWIYTKMENVPYFSLLPHPKMVIELYTPRGADDGIYYEIYGNTITDGYHDGGTQDQDVGGIPAITTLYGTGDAYWRQGMLPQYFSVHSEDSVNSYLEVESAFLSVESKSQPIGKPAVEDVTQTRRFYSDRFYSSDIYIQNGSINGLSSVRIGAFKQIDQSFGILKKLIMSGEVLLAICEHRVQPIYVGKSRFLDLSGNSTIGRSDQLFNLGDDLKEMAGTKHPASVYNAFGNTYFWDQVQGKWWRYNNGLFPISDYGWTKYFRDNAVAVGYDLPNLNNVVGGYDPKYKMPLMSIRYNNDGVSARTLGFSEDINGTNGDVKGFVGEFFFWPDLYCTIGQDLFTFKDGRIYAHNRADTYCDFYGTQWMPEVIIAANAMPSEMKVFHNIRVTCPQQKLYMPNNYDILIPATAQFPDGMASRLKEAQWHLLEGKWYADFKRDMNDTAEPFASIVNMNTRRLTALNNGRFLRGEYILLRFKPLDSSAYFELYQVDVEYSLSHPTKIKK